MTKKKELPEKISRQVGEIIEAQFGIKPDAGIVNIEIIHRADDPEGYDRARTSFEEATKNHPDRESILKRSYYGDTFSLHLQSWHPESEVKGIPTEHVDLYPICSREEIQKIANPRSAADFLLALNANTIADTPRLKRLFMKRRNSDPNNWSLTRHLDSPAFKTYLARLPRDKRRKAAKVPAGVGYLREPNGLCIRSEFGDVVVIASSLREYLYYMNLFLLGFEHDLPADDSTYALLIATRTMFLTEAPDFDLDPRGKPNNELGRMCEALTEEQLQFVIGHEYAHVILGHLDAKFSQAIGVLGLNVFRDAASSRLYTPRQQQEFEADVGALLHQGLSNFEVAQRLNAAHWFFFGLDVLYAISGYINPSTNAPNSHPDPIDRLQHLRKAALTERNLLPELIGTDEDLARTIEFAAHIKASLLKNFVPYQIEVLEGYGSVYLPSFRGSPLQDRIDF